MPDKIINFTFENIVELHNDIIENSGGDQGVMNPSSLEFALDRIIYYSDETSLFEDVALLLRGITQDHPFVDGNKRTGLVVAQSILIQNGLILNLDDKGIEIFILKVAKCEFSSIDELATYLKENCIELE